MTGESKHGASDIVYTDGQIQASATEPPAEAILIRGGRVAAVGSNADVLAAAGPGVERQNLDGATVIPGLIDTHPHLLHFAAFKAPLTDISDAHTHEDIVQTIRATAARTPAGEWIPTTPVGEPHFVVRRSYRDLVEGVLPDRHVLDRATRDHPVLIQAWAPTVPNVCAVNSAGLAALGIDAATPDRVSNVWIDKDRNGDPTGILRGSVNVYYNDDPFFLELLGRMAPLIRPELLPQALIGAMADYNGMGITTIFEAHAMEAPHIDLYKALRAQQMLTLRVQTAPELEPNALPHNRPLSLEEIRTTLEAALAQRTLTDDWLRIDGITTCAWGPANCGRMWWPEGYTGPWGERTTGRRAISEEKMQLAIDFCAEQGLRLNLLSCSPAEHDEYIRLTTEAVRKHDLDRTGWLIEHGYVMREDQPRQLAELGFDMTISMALTFGKGDMFAERFGPDMLKWLNPLRNLLDSGMAVAGSMDWGPTNPFEQMQLAVTHQMLPSGRSNAGPAQSVSREEAFEMWTASGAKVLGWDGIGTLTPGAHADLAIVDRNPITCDLDELPATQVLRTTVAGRVVHDNGAIAAPETVRAR